MDLFKLEGTMGRKDFIVTWLVVNFIGMGAIALINFMITGTFSEDVMFSFVQSGEFINLEVYSQNILAAIVTGVIAIALLWINIAIHVRRLADAGLSAWFLLTLIAGTGATAVIGFLPSNMKE